MSDYIDREAYIESVKDIPLWGSAAALLADCFPAAEVAPVRPELRKAVNQLQIEYEKALQLPFVRNPLAYALYHVWKAVDREATKDGD